MSLRYRSAGFAVVIDDFVDPHQMHEYHTFRAHPRIYKCVLYPGPEVARERNVQRGGERVDRDYIDSSIRFVYQYLQPILEDLRHDGWIVVDTTTLTV